MSQEPTEPIPQQLDQMSFEARYATFDYKQQGFADELIAGVMHAKTRQEEVRHLHRAYRDYTGDTTSYTYIEDTKDQLPVIEYVADTADAEFKKGARDGDHTAEAALSLLETVFERYSRLAHYPGHTIYGPQLTRVYFPMRQFFREACRISIELNKPDVLARWQERWTNISNGPEAAMAGMDKEVEERQELYESFLLDPTNGEIWSDVEHQAKHEEARGEIYPRSTLADVPVENLTTLAGLVREGTKEEQYVRMSQRAPNGEQWSSLLPGYSDSSLTSATKRFLDVIVTREEAGAGKTNRRQTAVILGARDPVAVYDMAYKGVIERQCGHIVKTPVAEHVTVVEQSEVLRNVAEEQLEGQAVDFVSAALTDLPFDDKTQELLVGSRLTESMDKQTLTDFYFDISRVLKNGGIYIEGVGTRRPDDAANLRWKGLLAQMVVDTVRRPEKIPDRMDNEQERFLLESLGFVEKLFHYNGERIRVLTKHASIKDIGYHALHGRGVEHLFTVEPVDE